MIVKYVLTLLTIIFFSSKLVIKLTKNKFYRNINVLLWSFYSIAIILLYYDKYFFAIGTYLLGIIISLLIIFKYLKLVGLYNKMCFWGLYIISTVTLLGIMLTTYFYKSYKFKEPPKGNKGKIGNRGVSGKDSTDLSDVDLCIAKLTNYSSEIYKNWKKNNGFNQSDIKNLYFKDRIKKICKSQNFENSTYEIGIVKTINKLKKTFRNIVLHILEYKKGNYFLNSHMLNDYHWKNLSNTSDPSNSPFESINNNEIWNWGNCKSLNSMLKDRKKYNRNNLCRK